MEYFVYILMIAAIVWGLWYAKRKVDSLTFEEENPVRLVASYTTKLHRLSNKDIVWSASVYLYSDGTCTFKGTDAKTWFEEKDSVFQKYIIPLANGVNLSDSDRFKAKAQGVQFY